MSERLTTQDVGASASVVGEGAKTRDDRLKADPDTAPLEAIKSGAWSLHYRQGYEEGYRMAVDELLKSLLSMSEEFIAGDAQSGEELRRIVYRFEEHLERRLWRMSANSGFVEGGLGI